MSHVYSEVNYENAVPKRDVRAEGLEKSFSDWLLREDIMLISDNAKDIINVIYK